MMRIKKSKQTNPKVTGELKPKEYVCFSLRHLTTNKHYNFEFFKDYRQKLDSENAFIERMKELSSNSWEHWNGLRKNGGYELLPVNQINIPASSYPWSQEQKKEVVVFRFGAKSNSNYRIIGVKEQSDPTLYIIGFDFDHSAYNH